MPQVLYGSAPAMPRPKPLATVIAALALLGCALYLAPTAVTQNGTPTLSPTPPVRLLPPSTNSTTTPPTPATQPERLPKTGLDTWLIALVGVGMVLAGEALRRAIPRRAPRRSG